MLVPTVHLEHTTGDATVGIGSDRAQPDCRVYEAMSKFGAQ